MYVDLLYKPKLLCLKSKTIKTYIDNQALNNTLCIKDYTQWLLSKTIGF